MYQGKDPTEVDQKVGLSRRQHNETTECMPCFGQRGSDLLARAFGGARQPSYDSAKTRSRAHGLRRRSSRCKTCTWNLCRDPKSLGKRAAHHLHLLLL